MTDAKTELTAEQMAWAWLSLLDEHAARGKRIAELESALALATEAVAAEAMAKVEGLTCAAPVTSDETLDSLCDKVFARARSEGFRCHISLTRPRKRARREAAKAKGDGNG